MNTRGVGWVSVGVMLIMVMLLGACGDGDLSLEEWETRWEEVVEEVATTIDEGVADESACDETLGYLRERRPDLTPPPLGDLEVPVDAWFEEAEGLFFECTILVPGAAADQLTTLHALEAEVTVILQLEG
jgi:hypothetical protein